MGCWNCIVTEKKMTWVVEGYLNSKISVSLLSRYVMISLCELAEIDQK